MRVWMGYGMEWWTLEMCIIVLCLEHWESSSCMFGHESQTSIALRMESCGYGMDRGVKG